MKGIPGHAPAYRPADFVRGYDRDLILDHVGECLEIFDELADARPNGIDPAIAPSVFSTIQTMVASVEPSPEKLEQLATQAKLAGAGNGVALLGKS